MLHDESMPTEDPVVILTDDETPTINGKIADELDENGQPTGFKVFVPTPEEKKRMEQTFADNLDAAEELFQPIWEQATINVAAYECMPDDDKRDLLQIPVGKGNVNHLVGFHVNRIMGKKPIASVIPEEFGQYNVAIPQRDPQTGAFLRDANGAIVAQVQVMDAEEIVQGGEQLLEHYLRGPKLGFRKFLYTVIMRAIQGASPEWGKTCYERVLRPSMVPKWKRLGNDMVVMDGWQSIDRVVGSAHHLFTRSCFDVMMPAPWMDVQEAEWASEHEPLVLADAQHKYKMNEWYLCTPDDWKEVRKGMRDLTSRYEEKSTADEVRAQQAPKRVPLVDLFKVSTFWPVVFDDKTTGQTMEGVFSLNCQFDRTTGKLLAAPLNPYAHGMRNLVPYVQRPRPYDITGYSTMEDVLGIQKVQTRLFHSQVQNAMLANTAFAKVRIGSVAWNWLKQNEIRARSKVPVTNPQDFESAVLGRELRSLAPEVMFLEGQAKELTVSDTLKGANLLGRTPTSAINLMQEAGLTVPSMDLEFIRESISRNLTMLFHNIGQWSAYGEDIPFRNPETYAKAMAACRFPMDGLASFSVRINASADDETTQFEFERNVGLAKLQQSFFATAATILGPMLSPQAPPVVEELQKPMFLALNRLFGRIMELADMDPKKFVMNERQLDDVLARHQQWVAQQRALQQEAAQAQQEQQRLLSAGGSSGGQTSGNVVRGAFGGGGVPGEAPSDAPGNGPVGEAPSDAGS